MKVAVIGAGNWGKNLVRTLNSMGVLAAVAEAHAPTREALAKEYPGVPFFESYEPILSSEVPAVAIATPAPSHHAVAGAALRAGKDVFVEKPLTLSVSDAEALVRLAAEQKRLLMVGHLLMYQPAIAWIKEQLRAGIIGKLHSLHQERLNLGRARAVENALWSLGVHDIAVMLHLVGTTPTGVSGGGQCALQPGIEDDFYLHLRFPGEVQAHLHTSWLWPERRRRLTVVGSRGMLVYDELAQKVVLHRKRIEADLRQYDEGDEVVFEGSGEPLRLEMEHFLACVQSRQKPLSDGANGVAVIRVLQAAMEGQR